MTAQSSDPVQRKTISDPIDLEVPIVRGEQKIDKLQLRRPIGGDLRGLNLHDILKLDVNQVRTLLPRITVPTILPEEATALDPVDLVMLSTELADFFTPSALRPDSPPKSIQ